MEVNYPKLFLGMSTVQETEAASYNLPIQQKQRPIRSLLAN